MDRSERNHVVATRFRTAMAWRNTNPTRLSVAIRKRLGDSTDRNYVRSILRGADEPDRLFVPSHEKLIAAAAELQVSVDWLFGDSDDPSVDAAALVPETAKVREITAIGNRLSDTDQQTVLDIAKRLAETHEDPDEADHRHDEKSAPLAQSTR